MAVSLKANSLITAEELETILQITISDSDYKNTLINIASDFCDKYTGRTLKETAYTSEQYDGNNERNLFLKNFPISSSATFTVQMWDTVNDQVIETLTINNDYLVYYDEGYIYKRTNWHLGHRNVRVTYTAGYAIADVPYDLKNACAQVAGIYYYNKGSTGIASKTMGAFSVSYDKAVLAKFGIAVPMEITAVLNQYIRTNI